MLLGRAIRSLFSILGWPSLGLFLYSLLAGAGFLNMVGPEGAGAPDAQDAGPGDAPNVDFLERRISYVLRGCQHINIRRDVLTRIVEDLHLSTASPEKTNKNYGSVELYGEKPGNPLTSKRTTGAPSLTLLDGYRARLGEEPRAFPKPQR